MLVALGYCFLRKASDPTRNGPEPIADDSTVPEARLTGQRGAGAPGSTSPDEHSVATEPSVLRTKLSGRTLTVAGGAIEGARISVAYAEAVQSDSKRNAVGTATSSADGSWRIEIDGPLHPSLGLIATAPGLQSREYVLNTEGDVEHGGLILTLHKLTRITCSVIERHTKSPVGDVPVGVSSAYTIGLPASDTARTNGRGVCEFDVPVGPCSVRVYLGGGFAPGVHVFVPAEGKAVTLEVPRSLRECTLRLEWPTTGEIGEGPISVTVRAFGSLARRRFDTGRGSARLSFPGDRPEGTVHVSVARSGFPPMTTEFRGWREATPGGVLRVAPGPLSSGVVTVRDKSTGQALPELRFKLRLRSSPPWSVGLRTNDSGEAEYTTIAGEYDAHIGRLVVPSALELPAGSAVRPQLDLAGYGVLRGRLGASLLHLSPRGRYLRVASESPRSDLPDSAQEQQGAHRSSRPSSRRPFSFRLRSETWAIAVPWPSGTRVAVSLRTGSSALSQTVDGSVGGPALVLVEGDLALATVKIRPIVPGVHWPAGYVVLSTEDLSESPDTAQRGQTYVSLIDRRSGLAQVNHVPHGEYFVYYTPNRSAKRPGYGARERVRVGAAGTPDGVIEVPFGAR